MKIILLLPLLVASCISLPQSIPVGSIMTAIPADLRSCPVAPEPAPVPPKPRTFESVVAWANANEDLRDKTLQALKVCRHKLIELTAWVQEHAQ